MATSRGARRLDDRRQLARGRRGRARGRPARDPRARAPSRRAGAMRHAARGAAHRGDRVSVLEVEALEVVYHRVATAIQGVSLHVPERSIVALVGPNGAGKTTTLRAISGFLDADDARITNGAVRYDGAVTNGWPIHRAARAGLVLVPEREKVFESLTVQENLDAAH